MQNKAETIKRLNGATPTNLSGPILLDTHNLHGVGPGYAWGSFFENAASVDILAFETSPVLFRNDGGQFGLIINVDPGWKLYCEIEAEAPTYMKFSVNVSVDGIPPATASYSYSDGAYWFFILPDLGMNGEARIGIALESSPEPTQFLLNRMRFWLFR